MRVDARKRSARTRFREWAASVSVTRAGGGGTATSGGSGGKWPARITQATHARDWILLGGSHI